MRLLALATILALSALVALCGNPTEAAPKHPPRPSPPRPTPPPNFFPRPILPMGYPGGFRPGRYRPGTRFGNGMRVVNTNINVTFTFNSEAGKVRTMSPPEEFDDKGNIKKHTKEELQALKGDTPAEKKMVGYKSDINDVQVNDVVEVSLSVFKPTKAKAAPKKKAKKDKDAEDDKDARDELEGKKEGKWVVATRLVGKVTKVNAANTDGGSTLTIQVTTQTLQGRGAPKVNTNQTLDPEKGQATFIVIGKRAPQAAPKGGKNG